MLSVFSRSAVSNWTVAIEIPGSDLEQRNRQRALVAGRVHHDPGFNEPGGGLGDREPDRDPDHKLAEPALALGPARR